MKRKKEIIESLAKDNVRLIEENKSLKEDNQRLRLDLCKKFTKIIKLNKVLDQLIVAICYSEDEKLLKTCSKIFKDFGEEQLWKETSTN